MMKRQHFNVSYLPECMIILRLITLVLLLILKYKIQVLLPPLNESDLPDIHIVAVSNRRLC